MEWHDLRVIEINGWALITGHKRREDTLKAVLPLPLHTTSLKSASLKQVFSSLSTLSIDILEAKGRSIPQLAPDLDEIRRTLHSLNPDPDKAVPKVEEPPNRNIDKEMIYFAIAATDSTVVYYKLSRGIKKPADIPDE